MTSQWAAGRSHILSAHAHASAIAPAHALDHAPVLVPAPAHCYAPVLVSAPVFISLSAYILNPADVWENVSCPVGSETYLVLHCYECYTTALGTVPGRDVENTLEPIRESPKWVVAGNTE